MRIKCRTIGAFVDNLRAAESVYAGVVYFERWQEAISEVSDRRFYQASAVIILPDQIQALLSVELSCGVDRATGDGGMAGSREQERTHDKLKSYCDDADLVMRPGILDVS